MSGEQQDAGLTPEPVEIEDATTSPEPAEIESAEAPSTDEQEVQTEQKDEPKKSGAEKRIAQLVYEREEANRRAEQLAQILEERRQQPPAPQPEQVKYPDAPPQIPDRFDYDSDDDFRAAQAKFQQDLRLYVQGENKRAKEELFGEVTQAKAQRATQSFIQETVDKGKQKYEDFAEVGFIPRGMEGIFQQADNPIDIAYHLGNHREEIDRLMRLPPAQAAFEIAKLDAKFSVKPEKKTTKAPEPVTPIGGEGPATTNILDLPVEDYIREMNKRQFGG